MGKPKLPSGQIRSQVRKFQEMKEKRNHKGGRKPLPDEEKRKNLVATKLTDIEFQVLVAKIGAFKMTMYEYLQKAINDSIITAKQYEDFVKIVDQFSISHIMRLCVIQSVVYTRLTPEEVAIYKDLNMNLRNYGRNIRGIAIEATMRCGGSTNYVAAVEKELEWLKSVKKKIQEQLML